LTWYIILNVTDIFIIWANISKIVPLTSFYAIYTRHERLTQNNNNMMMMMIIIMLIKQSWLNAAMIT